MPSRRANACNFVTQQEKCENTCAGCGTVIYSNEDHEVHGIGSCRSLASPRFGDDTTRTVSSGPTHLQGLESQPPSPPRVFSPVSRAFFPPPGKKASQKAPKRQTQVCRFAFLLAAGDSRKDHISSLTTPQTGAITTSLPRGPVCGETSDYSPPAPPGFHSQTGPIPQRQTFFSRLQSPTPEGPVLPALFSFVPAASMAT